jgi:hypothetical protein
MSANSFHGFSRSYNVIAAALAAIGSAGEQIEFLPIGTGTPVAYDLPHGSSGNVTTYGPFQFGTLPVGFEANAASPSAVDG